VLQLAEARDRYIAFHESSEMCEKAKGRGICEKANGGGIYEKAKGSGMCEKAKGSGMFGHDMCQQDKHVCVR
jgi:hypothetical protein